MAWLPTAEVQVCGAEGRNATPTCKEGHSKKIYLGTTRKLTYNFCNSCSMTSNTLAVHQTGASLGERLPRHVEIGLIANLATTEKVYSTFHQLSMMTNSLR